MSYYILGISSFFHDSAAALTKDGTIIAAAQEERFSRVKHDSQFPSGAINYCLEEAFIESDQLSAVIFYDNPIWKFDRIVKSGLNASSNFEERWPRIASSFIPKNFFLERFVQDELKTTTPVFFCRHHLSHASSAFFPSPFDNAAILTVDGVGEWATTSISFGESNNITTLKEIHFPHSLGLLYSAFTYFCGFKVNSGEYKLMGLAPYGNPVYVNRIKDNLIEIRPDGSFRLNLDYFGFADSDSMINEHFDDLFDGEARKPESRITRREVDLAASIQTVTEEIMIGLAQHAYTLTDTPNLCLAGGVALNCVANGQLLRKGPFENLWIQPASGDAGGALGAALAGAHMKFRLPRKLSPAGADSLAGSYLGPSYSNHEIRAFLERYDIPNELISDQTLRAQRVAALIADGAVVGFFSGRMEFGPRALGSRSILGDPRNPNTQTRMNLKIKYRESFRPFAPSVLAKYSDDWFDLDSSSPYMLLVAPVKSDKSVVSTFPPATTNDIDLLSIVSQVRSKIPAVTHVDYSARVQTVDGVHHSDFFHLLTAFNELTGCPVLVNTSFNVRGEPIVCTPDDAYRCFMGTEMDALVLEEHLLLKTAQPKTNPSEFLKSAYELD